MIKCNMCSIGVLTREEQEIIKSALSRIPLPEDLTDQYLEDEKEILRSQIYA